MHNNQDHHEIYTVYKSLQDEYVAKNLHIDLGSLSEFLELKTNKRAVPQKTTIQAQDDDQVNNPKKLVQQIFVEVFKSDLQTFEEQHSSVRLENNYKFQNVDPQQRKSLKSKNHGEVFQQELARVTSKPELKLKLEAQQTFKAKNKNSGSEIRVDEGDSSKKSMLRIDKQPKKFFQPQNDTLDIHSQLQQRLNNILKMRKYTEFNTKWCEYWKDAAQATVFETLLQAQKKPELDSEFHAFQLMEHKSLELLRAMNYKNKSSLHEQVILINAKNIIFRNKTLEFPHLVYLSMSKQPFKMIQRLEFYNTSLCDSSQRLIFSLFPEFKFLETINLSGNQITAFNTFTEQLSHVLQTLKHLKLSDISLNTKQFLELSLVIYQCNLEHLDVSHNYIISQGYDSIELLLKYMKTLQYLDVSGNQIEYDEGDLSIKKARSLKHLESLNKLYSKNVKRVIRI